MTDRIRESDPIAVFLQIIKDELWPNPLQCFQMAGKHPDESEEDDDPNDSG